VTNLSSDDTLPHDDTASPQGSTTRPGPVRRHAAPSTRTPWSAALGNGLRGGMVGAAESVPGISGGTIALVVGLYDGLLGAASQLVHAARELVQGVAGGRGLRPARAALRQIDWPFLLPVLVGMVVILLVSLNTIAPLLESNPVPMRALFFGMIAVSVSVPLRMMPHRFRVLDVVLLVGGAVGAYFLTGLPAAEISDPSLWLVFVGAAIAINALVLPGVSGSFVLLAMGLYIPVQEALHDRDLAFVGTFMLGAAVGLGSFVKVLHWLLEHRRQGTMALLAGLMIGSLRALWPWQDEAGGLLAPPGDILVPLLLALLGAAVVAVAVWWESRRAPDTATPE
jgi:putative membrane protein